MQDKKEKIDKKNKHFQCFRKSYLVQSVKNPDDANVNYKKDIGFIEINGTNCNFRINTAMVCGYEKEDNEVKFDLENILVKLVW